MVGGSRSGPAETMSLPLSQSDGVLDASHHTH